METKRDGNEAAAMPVPWEVITRGDWHTDIHAANGERVLLVANFQPNAQANAILAVRAVNAHDELVGALKWLVENTADSLESAEMADYCRKDVEHALERARAALAKAKGGAL